MPPPLYLQMPMFREKISPLNHSFHELILEEPGEDEVKVAHRAASSLLFQEVCLFRHQGVVAHSGYVDKIPVDGLIFMLIGHFPHVLEEQLLPFQHCNGLLVIERDTEHAAPVIPGSDRDNGNHKFGNSHFLLVHQSVYNLVQGAVAANHAKMAVAAGHALHGHLNGMGFPLGEPEFKIYPLSPEEFDDPGPVARAFFNPSIGIDDHKPAPCRNLLLFTHLNSVC